MKKRASKKELMGKIVQDMQSDVQDEEAIQLLLYSKQQPGGPPLVEDRGATFGQRAADSLASYAGSWRFILAFCAVLLLWIAFNIVASLYIFDPYPFVLLNLVLSCVAAIQAPLIMMSQNRREHKDRQRAEKDYQINLKSEIILEDLHQKINYLIELQKSKSDGQNPPP